MLLHKVPIENTICVWLFANFPKSIQLFTNFTIGMIGNETWYSLECVILYGKLININVERKYCCYYAENAMFSRLVCSIKHYVFTLSLWNNFPVVLDLF